MIVDQNDKVCPRKCHPLPLSVSQFRVIAGGTGRVHCSTCRQSQYISGRVSRVIPAGESFSEMDVVAESRSAGIAVVGDRFGVTAEAKAGVNLMAAQ